MATLKGRGTIGMAIVKKTDMVRHWPDDRVMLRSTKYMSMFIYVKKQLETICV